MSKLISSPWIAVALAVAQFVLGLGTAPFDSLTTFQQWIAEHLPQTGLSGVIAYALWYVMNMSKRNVNKDVIRDALKRGQLGLAELVKGVEDGSGVLNATVVKSAAADSAFVTLYHASDFDEELTDSLNSTHSLYRKKRCELYERKASNAA